MASISNSKTLFGFTSPRTIEKSIPELKLLTDEYSGQKWERNPSLHKDFFLKLFHSDFYEGRKLPENAAFAGRDRITRAIKSYGFVDLNPTVKLTEAGKELLETTRPDESFLRQMLKFQLPSFYHTDKNNNFNVKPYLELIRLIYTIKGLSKTELSLFFLQLINHNQFDNIVEKIHNFRRNAKKFQGSRKTYVDRCFNQEISEIYSEEIASKNFKTRESAEVSFRRFVKTKKGTMLDYGDAFMRHLRATNIISFEKRTLRLIINKSKIKDVEFLLESIDRDAKKFTSEKVFKTYLFSATNLELYSDNENRLLQKLEVLGEKVSVGDYSINELKDKIEIIEEKVHNENLLKTQTRLKTYEEFDDIIDIFDKIKNRDVPDAPLFLEWNIWRALVMINYSKWVEGNFISDLDGVPINTAGGNKADIEAEYDNFGLITEVTMSSGNRQYEMEGEPVPRHFGKFKAELGKDTYCLFIAPKISIGALSHYFNLNRFHTKSYGGKTKIIPLNIDQFIHFISVAKDKKFDNSSKLQKWMEDICQYNQGCKDEDEWSRYIGDSIDSWAA